MGQHDDRPAVASALVAALFRCFCSIMLAYDATRMDATSWHLAHHCPVTASWPAGSLCRDDRRPVVLGPPTPTAPSSRRRRNVASDATPRLSTHVKMVWRIQWLLMPWVATQGRCRP